MILEVPFYTQEGNHILNDCGETSLRMVIKYTQNIDLTVAQIEEALHTHNQQESINQLVQVSIDLGVPFTRHIGNIDFVKSKINERKPCICLMRYKRMPSELRAPNYKKYEGGHFITVIGYGDMIDYFDPLYKNETKLSISFHAFEYAWWGNDMIYPLEGKPVPIEPDLPDLPINEALDMNKDEYAAAIVWSNVLSEEVDKYRDTGIAAPFFRKSTGLITAYNKEGLKGNIAIPAMEVFYLMGGEDGKWTNY